MEKASLSPSEMKFVLDPDATGLPDLGHPTCPATLDRELHHCEGLKVGSSAGSESGPLDATESVVNHLYEGVSEITEQTGATTVDGDGDFDAAHSRDLMLGCDKQDRNMYDLNPRINTYEGRANIAPVIQFSGDTSPGFAREGTDRDQFPIKLDHSPGSALHYHQLGISDEMPGADAEESSGTNIKMGQVNALWRHPKESNCEVRDAIDEVKRLHLLPDPTPGGHLQGITITPYATKVASDPFSAAANSCTTRSKSLPTEADWKALSSPSSAARQARMNLINGEIYRLMPPDRTIHFDVDTDSFADAKIPSWAIRCIEEAASEVSKVFTQQILGITFAYAGIRDRKVFSIRHGFSLPKGTLAQSFFPCDPPEDRQVRISSLAIRRAYGRGGHSRYMRIILAHEFMHILGFRHWHAGSDKVERQSASFLWPGTDDDDMNSIMYTPLYSGMGFSEDDFRVIREVYSEPNRTLVKDCLIVDVDPYDGRYVL